MAGTGATCDARPGMPEHSCPITRSSMLAAMAATGVATSAPRFVFAADLTPVRLGSALQDDIAPIFYGISQGIFARFGLDISVEPAQSGAAAAAAVAGGALSMAKTGPISMVTGHARGVPFVVVAPSRISTPEHPIGYLLVRNDGPIHSAKDLNGKIIAGSALADLNALVALEWIDQNGGDAKSVKLAEVPASSLVVAITEGRIDAGTSENPVLFDALQNKAIRSLGNPFDALGKRYVASCWFTTKDFVARNPDVVKRFQAALKESVRGSLAHLNETATAVAPFLHADPAKLVKMGPAPVGVDLVARELQPIVDVAYKYGLIKAPFDAQELIVSA